MADVQILLACQRCRISLRSRQHTLIPSSEKHGGTALLSSSASLKSIGNFSTADIGISPL